MALLDELLGGGSNGGILSSILGGSNNESTQVDSNANESAQDFSADPSLGLNLSDVLQSESFNSDGEDGDVNYESFGGIGDLDLDLDFPISASNSNAEESFSGSQSETDGGNGGLLGGLL